MIRPLVVLFLLLTLLTGLAYPLAVTGLAQLAFPAKANGSLVLVAGQARGSSLIGQEFIDPRYFWGRPSATAVRPYTAFDPQSGSGSAGSNEGPLSHTLLDQIRARVLTLMQADPENRQAVPVDLVTASGSGLDPDISLATAYYQVPRVAKARGLSEAKVRALVDRNASWPQFGFLGEPRVNVLKLNLALDAIQ